VDFLTPSRYIPVYYFKFSQERFISNPLLTVIKSFGAVQSQLPTQTIVMKYPDRGAEGKGGRSQSHVTTDSHSVLCFRTMSLLADLGSELIENTAVNSSSVAACVSVAAESSCHMFFSGRYHATDDFFWLSGVKSCHNTSKYWKRFNIHRGPTAKALVTYETPAVKPKDGVRQSCISGRHSITQFYVIP
jgi:hypothetical protein